MSVSVRPASREDARVIAEAVAMAIGSESAVLYCGENYLDVLEEIALEKGTQYSYENSSIASVGGVPALFTSISTSEISGSSPLTSHWIWV